MKIVKLQAENVKKLKAIQIVPEGNVIKITGKNEQGKTTVLDSIWWALAGTKNIQEQPIRSGEKEASITIDLGEMIVTRTFTETGSYLKVENGKGMKFSSPQALLDKIIGKLSFNPLEFATGNKAEDKARRVETLLKIVDLKVDKEKIKELAGIVPKENNNPLEMINEAYKFVEEERTVVNRDLTRVKKVLESLPKITDPVKPVTVLELVSEKDRMVKANLENQEVRDSLTDCQENISRTKAEIEDLEARLIALKESLDNEEKRELQLQNEISKLTEYDLIDIGTQISQADETNAKFHQWENQEKTIADIMEFQQEYNHLTKVIESIKKYKKELISTTQFPVDGLDFGDGGVLYQGLPFEQASSAQKLQVSLAIAMKLNPELRVIRIDDGSLLDSAHMQIIEQMAKDNDFQVWMECVDESGKVGIYIEDGEIKSQQIVS